MKQIRRGLITVLMFAMVLQCMVVTGFAEESGGFTNVRVEANVDSQTVSVEGRLASGTAQDITILFRHEESLLHADQFVSESDGTFLYQFPTDLEEGGAYTLMVGGQGVADPYRYDFVIGEGGGEEGGTVTLSDVGADVSLSGQTVTVSGKTSGGADQVMTLMVRRNGTMVSEIMFYAGKDGSFAYTAQIGMQAGDKLYIEVGGQGVDVPFHTELTVKNTGSTESPDSGGGPGGGLAGTSYTITGTAGEGGGISPVKCLVAKNDSVTFTIKPNTGYEVKDVLVDGKSVGAVKEYTFRSVVEDHKISAVFLKIGANGTDSLWENPFTDVAAADWYYPAVQFTSEAGLFSGTGAATFAPQAAMTRGMLVTVLYRLAGEPEAESGVFSDVAAGSWYEKAVSWAAASEIVKGTGNGVFAPEAAVTREQIATILYRYAQVSGGNPPAAGELDQFPDGALVSAYAVKAMRWAVGMELLKGKSGGLLDGAGNATRAEVATILMRFVQITSV